MVVIIVVYFVIDSVRKLLDTSSYKCNNKGKIYLKMPRGIYSLLHVPNRQRCSTRSVKWQRLVKQMLPLGEQITHYDTNSL